MPRVQDTADATSSRTRSSARRARASAPGGSCDLLLTLCTRDPVAELLGGFGASAGALLAARDDLEAVLGAESADWRVRLEGRGGGDGDLEQLLAICRSAECHAYQLIEQVGLQCAALRREIIVRLRTRQVETPARTRASVAAARPAGANMARDRRPEPTYERSGPRRAPASDTSRPLRAAAPAARPASASRYPPEGFARVRRGAELAPRPPSSSAPGLAPDAVPSPPAHGAREDRQQVRQTASAGPAAPAVAPPHGVDAQRVDPEELSPLEGRSCDLAQLCDALGRHGTRVPLLVGAPGSGRSLLASHIATQIETPVFHLVATAYDGEEALQEDFDAIEALGGIAIFDDIDRVPSEVAPAFLGALSHAWTQGAPRILTVVSPEGHARLANWLPGALQTADAIRIDPLCGPPLSAAVKAGAEAVLAAHAMTLAPDVRISEVSRWAERYLTGLAMPARALDVLDLASARARRNGAPQLTRALCLEVVSERSGLSAARIEAHGDHEVLDLEQRLAESVVGHEHATSAIAQLIRRNRAGFGGQRPVLSCLLLGPSGVGKTELAKALAGALFDDADALFRLDMSEYSEAHAVARVVGAPPGYVGHEQGGALTDPLLRRPHCVVLLDEIEKAHRDVHQLLLQVFDEGRLTDGRGRTVDFRHAVIVMTSNLGAQFVQSSSAGPRMDEADVCGAARSAFPVELWNRIEAPLVMQPLVPAQLKKICRRMARASSDRLFKERGIRYTLAEDACRQLVGLAGRDPMLGARPLRHLLVREVESVLADAILRGRLRAGSEATVDSDGRGRFMLR